MALTPEQIDRLIQQADRLAPKEGNIFRTLVRLTEAEVRKQDDALIQQLVEALQLLLEQDDNGEDEIWVRNKARAALAKCEGVK